VDGFKISLESSKKNHAFGIGLLHKSYKWCSS